MLRTRILLFGIMLSGWFSSSQVFAFDTSALGGSAGTAD